LAISRIDMSLVYSRTRAASTRSCSTKRAGRRLQNVRTRGWESSDVLRSQSMTLAAYGEALQAAILAFSIISITAWRGPASDGTMISSSMARPIRIMPKASPT
jgi:hypothetical protein